MNGRTLGEIYARMHEQEDVFDVPLFALEITFAVEETVRRLDAIATAAERIVEAAQLSAVESGPRLNELKREIVCARRFLGDDVPVMWGGVALESR